MLASSAQPGRLRVVHSRYEDMVTDFGGWLSHLLEALPPLGVAKRQLHADLLVTCRTTTPRSATGTCAKRAGSDDAPGRHPYLRMVLLNRDYFFVLLFMFL